MTKEFNGDIRLALHSVIYRLSEEQIWGESPEIRKFCTEVLTEYDKYRGVDQITRTKSQEYDEAKKLVNTVEGN